MYNKKQLNEYRKEIKSRLDILPKSTKQILLSEGISGRLKSNQIKKVKIYLNNEMAKVNDYERTLKQEKKVIPKLQGDEKRIVEQNIAHNKVQDKRDTERPLKGINPRGQDKVLMSLKRLNGRGNYRW